MDSQGIYFYQKRWFSSTLWSVGLHLLLILAAIFIHLGGFNENLKKEPLEFHLNKVRSNATLTEKGGGGGSGFPQVNVSQGVKILNAIQTRTVDETVKIEGPERVPMKSKFEPKPSSSRNLDTIILENEKEESSHRLAVRQQSLGEYYQKDAKKSVKAVAPSGEGLMKSLSRAFDKIQLYSPTNMGVDPEEGMPGFTPSRGIGGSGGGSWAGNGHGIGNGDGQGLGPGEGVGEPGLGVTKYESLDNFLDIQVYTYQDPADSQKYYMIKIYAKPGAQALKVMPKEILFTMDCSLSISPDRLDEFKRGIRYCLTHLNPNDVFNIIAFKDQVIFFSDKSIPATSAAVNKAERFVERLTASRATDVYSAFSKIIEKPLARVPSNIILISDGRPTYGVVDSRELINSVTRLNHKARPVFAFSGGAKVNRYLLDFIAYQNRAWSQFVRTSWDIHGGLANFYDKIKDPVFLNLRYQLNNLNTDEVFPKELPDFYRNAEFTLYGKYTDENDFSMQLLGDVDGKTKELIFTRALKDAKSGTEEIKRGYAFNKIYCLISRMTAESQTPGLLSQIESLSRQYGIQTPYSSEVEKKR